MKDRYFAYCKEHDIAREVSGKNEATCAYCNKPMEVRVLKARPSCKFEVKKK